MTEDYSCTTLKGYKGSKGLYTSVNTLKHLQNMVTSTRLQCSLYHVYLRPGGYSVYFGVLVCCLDSETPTLCNTMFNCILHPYF